MLSSLQNFLILAATATTVALILWQIIRPRNKKEEAEIAAEEEESQADL